MTDNAIPTAPTSAKNSLTAFNLAWCFFSAGMGSWTLFSFPEIGVIAGSWGVIGYSLSGVLGMLALGVRLSLSLSLNALVDNDACADW